MFNDPDWSFVVRTMRQKIAFSTEEFALIPGKPELHVFFAALNRTGEGNVNAKNEGDDRKQNSTFSFKHGYLLCWQY